MSALPDPLLSPDHPPLTREQRRLRLPCPTDILRQRPTEVSTKAYAVSYMRDQTGSLAYTRDVLSCLEEQANEEVRRLGGNPALEAIFDLMHVAPSPPSNDQEVA